MADGDYLLIFRSLETQDLMDRRDDLLDKMTTISSMGVGSKNFTRDLRIFKDQLAAIIFVLKERGTPCGYPRKIVFDFSGACGGEAPAGTVEGLT